MLRAYLLILACLLLPSGDPVEAADTQPPRASAAPSSQQMETILAMATEGDAGSQNYLGFLYATGQGVAKDEKTAFSWFRKAADQGHPEALGNLAMMYEKGLGVAKDPRQALALHRQAAMAGYPLSMKRLAGWYETGSSGEERDPIQAEMWKTRYRETLKTGTPATGDAASRQATEKTPAAVQAEKAATPKSVAPPTGTPPQTATVPVAGGTQAKPAAPSLATGAATTPYFIQIGGKATARETMDITQKIVEKKLLPQNKKIELVNPDGKNYHIHIGPFADARQAAPYKARIMALLNAAPEPEPAPASARPPPPVVPPSQAAPAKPSAPSATAKATTDEKERYVEVSGKAGAREASDLIRKIIEKGLLPKNAHVELVNSDADNYRIRIGPFAEAAPQKINAAPANPLPLPTEADQELIPAASVRKQPTPTPVAAPKIATAPVAVNIPAKPAAAPQPPQTASSLAAPPKTVSAPVAIDATAKIAEEKPATAKPVRGRYHFVQMNAGVAIEDSLFLAHFLFMKELVPETRRVKIENLDGKNYRISIGPFSDDKEARRQMQSIHQQTFQSLSVIALGNPAPGSGDGDRQPFIQVNAQGTLEQAMALARTLMEKNFLAQGMFAEIVNFGAGKHRVRFGPFKGDKEAERNIQNLKKKHKASPVLVNLERLVPAESP